MHQRVLGKFCWTGIILILHSFAKFIRRIFRWVQILYCTCDWCESHCLASLRVYFGSSSNRNKQLLSDFNFSSNNAASNLARYACHHSSCSRFHLTDTYAENAAHSISAIVSSLVLHFKNSLSRKILCIYIIE